MCEEHEIDGVRGKKKNWRGGHVDFKKKYVTRGLRNFQNLKLWYAHWLQCRMHQVRDGHEGGPLFLELHVP